MSLSKETKMYSEDKNIITFLHKILNKKEHELQNILK